MRINLRLDTDTYKKIQDITGRNYDGEISPDKVIDLIYDLVEEYEVLKEEFEDSMQEKDLDDRVDRYYEDKRLEIL